MRFLGTLADRILSRANRRVLNFSRAEEQPDLPSPDSGQRYLLYLHIPYCRVLCPFCSFHRVRFQRNRAEPYFESLRREIRLVVEHVTRIDDQCAPDWPYPPQGESHTPGAAPYFAAASFIGRNPFGNDLLKFQLPL